MNKLTIILRWAARLSALAILCFGLPFYIGYGNILPFIKPSYTLWDNLWLSIFPLMFGGLALGWKYEKLGGYLVTIPVGAGLLFGLLTGKVLVLPMLAPLATGTLFLLAGYNRSN